MVSVGSNLYQTSRTRQDKEKIIFTLRGSLAPHMSTHVAAVLAILTRDGGRINCYHPNSLWPKPHLLNWRAIPARDLYFYRM